MLAWDGGCRCGGVRVRVVAPPMLTMACHCLGCQTMSASAFSLSMALPLAGLEVVAGETVIGGLHGEPSHHHFCDRCKTWMFTRVEAFGLVNLRPTMLDRHGAFTPFIETQTAEKLPWATTPARHSFARFPAMEEYAALTREYQALVGTR
jgi:hypothetical protein